MVLIVVLDIKGKVQKGYFIYLFVFFLVQIYLFVLTLKGGNGDRQMDPVYSQKREKQK